MSASSKCLTAGLTVLNLIFLVLGIVVIIAGAYNIESTTDSNSAVFQTSIAIMVAGGLSIALGLFGIMGALCRNSCMLVTYIVLLSLLVVVQCVLGGLALSYGESDDKISEFSRTIWMSMGEDTRNLFQDQNSCCGYTNPFDNAGSNCLANGNVLPCMFAMEELTEKWFKNAGIYLFVAAGVQVVAAVTASVLLSDGRKRMAYVRDF